MNLLTTIFYQPLYNLFILILSLIPNHSVGLAIIVLTLLVRLIMTPLKWRAIESQMKQRELQPELKAIQDRHKDDRQAQSLAMMQLYKDKGINPASGCLPQLIQLPFLIALFYVFRGGLGTDYHLLYPFVSPPDGINTVFLWWQDITKPDETFVLPLLAGVTQFLFSRSLMASMPQIGGKNDMATIMSKQMMYMFPVMTVIIARSLPAALSIYWIVATLADWYQQTHGMNRYTKKQAKSDKVTVSVRQKKKEAS